MIIVAFHTICSVEVSKEIVVVITCVHLVYIQISRWCAFVDSCGPRGNSCCVPNH